LPDRAWARIAPPSPARVGRRWRDHRQCTGEILVTTFVTIDGVMQANGSPEHGRAEGFEYGGWQAPYTDAEVQDLCRT